MASSAVAESVFAADKLPAFVKARMEVWDKLVEKKKQSAPQSAPIKITLPDGSVRDGSAFVTTPLDIATQISPGLARAVLVAEVDGKLWDLTRPLESSCSLKLLKFEDAKGQYVFWHSSAHILGEALELAFQGHLCIGPPIEQGGFYYDVATARPISESDFVQLQTLVSNIIKDSQPFERMVITKQEALELFKDNKYKQQLISEKIKPEETTTAYRCGPLIDLCRGPHVPSTKRIEEFKITRNSAAYWLGKQENDQLNRVYGISFPSKKLLKEWETAQAAAAARDHRVIGKQQHLFFFHELTPGSAFWLPHGARIYNRLVQHMRSEYFKRGFEEVVTPNIFNHELWRISGHLQNYKDAIFSFKTREGEDFALKPMNCPGHCLMFGHGSRSYRELPIRFADFGVLHRNEASGALGGLTRVRRFQQDDAHIFCRRDQIASEIEAAIQFMEATYGIFKFDFDLALSTRPENFMGEIEVWNEAEAGLKAALDNYTKRSGKTWKLNPGDGAFYGPKIDIHVRDALKRAHQCATIQLDFQLPKRFELKYKGDDGNEHTPVIVHRAILGSLERFTGVLMEHTGGRWPLWISPRQIMIVPIAEPHKAYAEKVAARLAAAGFYVDTSISDKTLNKRILEASVLHYNYILVVGSEEEKSESVNVRPRPKADEDKKVATFVVKLEEFVQQLDAERDEKRLPADQDWYDPNAKAAPAPEALSIDENEYAV